MSGELVTRTLDANLASVTSDIIDVSDLRELSFYMVQKVDNGTVIATIDSLPDGSLVVNEGAAITESDLTGVDASVERVFSDSNGMPKGTVAVQLDITTYTGSGEYTLVVVGTKR